MFSHTLSNRPIVIPRNSRLRVEFPSVNKMPAYVNCSSNNMELLTPGATLLIEEYPQTLKLIHPMDYNYYETLRDKLHWAKTL